MPRGAKSAQHGLLPPLRHWARRRGLYARDLPIVKRKDEQAHGEYRTKRVILDIYDAMQQAMATGAPYHTRLDPPLAHGWTPPEITCVLPANLLDNANASEDKGLGYNAPRQQNRQQRPVGVST